jgi:hypothetical protein
MRKFLVRSLFLILLLSAGLSPAQMPGQPANSFVSGSNWHCSSGYKKSGNECVNIFEP